MLAVRLLALLSVLIGFLSVTGGAPASFAESGRAITTGGTHDAPFATLDAPNEMPAGFSFNAERATPPGRCATVTRRFFELPDVARPTTTLPLRWALADGPKTERGPPRSNRGA